MLIREAGFVRARALARSLGSCSRVIMQSRSSADSFLRRVGNVYRERAGDRILPRRSPGDASRARHRDSGGFTIERLCPYKNRIYRNRVTKIR